MPDVKEILTPAHEAVERWEEETLKPILNKRPESKARFQTVSLDDVNRLYTPADTEDINFDSDIAFPGEFPTRAAYTRPAIAASSGRCAFRRFRARPKKPTHASNTLCRKGQTGLSVAFDLAHANGLRPRLCALRRRSRQVRRRDFILSRHGSFVRWHSARTSHRLANH
jgi:methylmalonyl-CoA mutase N-terminal domain/subunit